MTNHVHLLLTPKRAEAVRRLVIRTRGVDINREARQNEVNHERR